MVNIVKSLYTIGVDEVGRGCLAGPVVAAAFACPSQELRKMDLYGWLRDSKQLSPKKRAMMALQIRKESELGVCMFAIGEATADEIDRINIRQATALAMERALQKLEQQLSSRLIESLVIDGNDHFSFESFANIKPFYIIRGDSKHRHIMAASIIAKVYRDTLLASFDSQYGGYGFVEHKGYGTKKHLSALHELWPCLIHRKTFAPVKSLI